MHASELLHNQILKSCPEIHKVRLDTLMRVVDTVANGASLAITTIGRHLSSNTITKYDIKRVDRLVGNGLLHAERHQYYQLAAYHAVGQQQEPIILVDWSGMTPCGAYHMLRASIPTCGRSVTIYEEVHPEAKYNNSQVNTRFLERLKDILPENCKPIIVTDSGFKNPWFNAVEKMGWDYVGRVRGNVQYAEKGSKKWLGCKSLFSTACLRGKYVGEIRIAKSNPINCHAYLIKNKKKNRVKKNLRGKKVKCSQSQKHAKGGNEPWLLVTSLPHKSKNKSRAFKIYRKRMEIEEGFRDTKSTHYGIGLNENRTMEKMRLENLLLIGMLGTLLLWLIGFATKAKDLHYRYQANTIKKRNVLSLVSIGRQVLWKQDIKLTKAELLDALEQISNFGEKS